MKKWPQFLRRYWQVLAVVLAIIILLIVVNAPQGNERLAGSTYSNQPSGYGAWYQMMVDRSTPIERWRKNGEELVTKYPTNTTWLRINPAIAPLDLSTADKDWIKQGNTLIVLGVDAPPRDIDFSQDLPSAQGAVRIETTRRLVSSSLPTAVTATQKIVGNSQGNVLVSAQLGAGRLIVSSTPHLAANAYQDWRPNYELLASLVPKQQRIVVDEYLHGYRDIQSADAADRTAADGLTYLLRTPWLVVLLNICLLLGVVIWQQNRRFGAVVIPQPPAVDNSMAYIQALGGVLRQARSSDFVMQNIGKAEQLALQQKLGLGSQQLVDRQTLLTAWVTQTKLPATDLQQVLQLATDHRRLNEKELRQWLFQWQNLLDKLPRPSL
jgi:Domain of unknown function (DUF4350)